MQEISYTANAGQTYIPFQDNIQVKPLPFTPLSRPEPAIPELELNPMALDHQGAVSAFSPGRYPRNAGLVLGQHGEGLLSLGARLP